MIVITKIFICFIVAMVAIFDIFMMINSGNNVTISSIICEYAANYPIIPFIFGLIAGHLFW